MSDNPLEQFINKKSSRAQEWHATIEEMLSSNRYIYAEQTLVGILDYIEEHDDISDAQIQAVENIRLEPSKHGW